MATLQKFKLLATQCAVATSPTRSPNASPVFQLRRRKTLRRLLSRSSSRRAEPPQPDRPQIAPDPPAEKKQLLSHTLKDLFVSSPPSHDDSSGCADSADRVPRVGAVAGRGVSRAFRYRMLRRVWRPVLVAIPESGE